MTESDASAARGSSGFEQRGRPRGPRLLSQAVESLRRSATPPTLLAKVQDCWSEAVGPTVAAEASPTSERGGIVTVTCRSAVWSSELEMLAPSLLEQLNRALPAGSEARALKFTTRVGRGEGREPL